jgi:hypothetical protein
MPSGSLRDFWDPVRRGMTLLYLLAVLLLLASCAPETPPTSPIIKIPSQVVTQNGLEFFVYGLKLPGTIQEFKLKEGETLTWVPLSIINFVRFTGPETDGYRGADILLTSGERFHGDLFVSQIIEGTTDIGYWNTSLREVKNLAMGKE